MLYFKRLHDDLRAHVMDCAWTTLLREPEGRRGREYLRSRGVDRKTAQAFGLGYVPPREDRWMRTHSPSWAGVIEAIEDSIVIPIGGDMGEDDLQALSFRFLGDRDRPKYWNESYAKGDYVYGLFQSAEAIAERGEAVVVEGQFDVLAMHAVGVRNAVGCLGGAFTSQHFHALTYFADRIKIMFDGDEAGERHSKRLRERMEDEDWDPAGLVSVEYVRLPPRTDPALLASDGRIRDYV